jgi:hypothetical protein
MNTVQEKTKAIVLEAFDTLFNQRNYEGASGRPTTSNTAPISVRGVKGYSVWSRAYHRRSGTNRARSLRTRNS